MPDFDPGFMKVDGPPELQKEIEEFNRKLAERFPDQESLDEWREAVKSQELSPERTHRMMKRMVQDMEMSEALERKMNAEGWATRRVTERGSQQ